jgi:uncharacterized protein YodC (DUF2158 family)
VKEKNVDKKEEIRKGDVVILRSGGPKMTVQSIGEPRPGMSNTKWIHCIWFEGNVINEYNFDECVLKVVQSDNDEY